MRLTRETLLKIARDTAAQRVRVSRRLVCIYLTGSLLSDEPLLGGTTDIDLVCVHDSEPIQAREIVRLNDDVHLDIAHYAQSVFRQPRHLRTDPWLGSFIYNKPQVLYDTQHWFEFTQASTSAQFYHADNAIHRANSLVQAARQAWTQISLSASPDHAANVKAYLQAIEDAGNAIVCLTGTPLTERRFFLSFPQKAQSFHQPELAAQFIALISPQDNQLDTCWNDSQRPWKETFLAAAAQPGAPARVNASRWPYYEKSAAALWQEHPIASLWIMISTWTRAAACLPGDSEQVGEWLSGCRNLRLDPENFTARLEALDQMLDRVEEILERWGKENGAVEYD